MSSEDHRMGITPIVLRRAAYYAQLGVGEYTPDHPHYDKVIVSKIYELTQNPTMPQEWAYGLRIDFCKEGRVVRWTEFSCRLVGAGGDSILRKVSTDE